MSAPSTPLISRRPSLPLIWVVPILAFIVAGWMVAQQFRNHGPEITIEFANGAGIEAGKTELEYKGVIIGLVKTVALDRNLTAVSVQVRLTKSGAGIARTGSEFWVVHPEVSLSGVRGLETLVTGVRIRVHPGTGAPAARFRGLDRPPPAEDRDAGRAFVLRTDKLDGLNPGSPVYYRGVKVGAIETTRLAADATNALIRIRIYTPYIDLVRTNSQFWNAGGLAFRLGLHGIDLRADSIEALLAGGVEFATPDRPDVAPSALDGTEFELHEKPEKDWLAWRPRIPIQPVESTPETSRRGAADSSVTLASHPHG